MPLHLGMLLGMCHILRCARCGACCAVGQRCVTPQCSWARCHILEEHALWFLPLPAPPPPPPPLLCSWYSCPCSCPVLIIAPSLSASCLEQHPHSPLDSMRSTTPTLPLAFVGATLSAAVAGGPLFAAAHEVRRVGRGWGGCA